MPSFKFIVVEKLPTEDGLRTSKSDLVIITIVALSSVFPETVTIFLLKIFSSDGSFTKRKIEGLGVGVGALIETVFVFASGRIFVY